MVNENSKVDIRQNAILDILNREGVVRVSTLSEKLGVSVVTIRSDLEKMENKNLLERIPGGAVPSFLTGFMRTNNSKDENVLVKQSIAATAAELVNEGETLMVNSGTTALYTVLELKRKKNLKIVTNSIFVAQKLSGLPNIRVILLGGSINAQFLFTYGNDAILQLKRYKADKVILSVDGVDKNAGLTTYNSEEAEIIKLMMDRSSKTIIVADSSKIGKESFAFISNTDQVDFLVTSPCKDLTLLNEIKATGTETIICKQL